MNEIEYLSDKIKDYETKQLENMKFGTIQDFFKK